MAEGTNAAVKLPEPGAANQAAGASAPIDARKSAIQAARERMSGNLDALETRVRTAVGARDHDATASVGQRRSVTAVGALITARRLWRLPFWRLTAIGVVTAGMVALGAWSARRRAS